MGFLFDSLQHLLAREPETRRAALARMIGRGLGVSPVRLSPAPGPPGPGARAPDTTTAGAGPTKASPEPEPGEASPDFGIWHAPKAALRPFAVTWTVGLSGSQDRELIALTLADSSSPEQDRFAGLLAAVAAAGSGAGPPIVLPEGTLGRSSHTRALVVPGAWPLRDEDEYARILGAPLQLVIPVTTREAAWIEARGPDAYIEAMKAQQVSPWADRVPGETELPPLLDQ